MVMGRLITHKAAKETKAAAGDTSTSSLPVIPAPQQARTERGSVDHFLIPVGSTQFSKMVLTNSVTKATANPTMIRVINVSIPGYYYVVKIKP